MKVHGWISGLIMVAVLGLTSGCVTIPSTNDTDAQETKPEVTLPTSRQSMETRILAEIVTMEAGERRQIDTLSIVTDEIYIAASGRQCRYIRLSGTTPSGLSGKQLTCSDGNHWSFAKDVFK